MIELPGGLQRVEDRIGQYEGSREGPFDQPYSHCRDSECAHLVGYLRLLSAHVPASLDQQHHPLEIPKIERRTFRRSLMTMMGLRAGTHLQVWSVNVSNLASRDSLIVGEFSYLLCPT